MQSTMDSWQFETFSTAELSPPISPAPPSPTLYSYSNVNAVPSSPYSPSTEFDNIKPVEAQKIMLQKQDPQLQQAGTAQSRAEIATNILKDLEKLQDMSFKGLTDFGGNWMEESVNLELFEELSEFAYDPPASPEHYANDETIQSSYPTISSHSPSHLSEDSFGSLQLSQHTPEYMSEDFNQLKAEFQAILESLPTDPITNGEVINIVGIPTTLVGDEELIPIDYADTLENDMGVEIEMEVDSIEDDSSYLVDEQDVYKLEDNSIDLSGQSSPESSVAEDEDDIEANTAEKILDALLQGDLQEAESYIPGTIVHSPAIVYLSDNSSTSYVSDTEESVVIAKKARAPAKSAAAKTSNKVKTERRGRKPASDKKSLAFVSDKALRKKEQNKTAATRYRQKKKMETHVVLSQEQEMQNEHDELAKQKEDLHRQIVMIKQLLREVVQAKKVTKKATVNRRKL